MCVVKNKTKLYINENILYNLFINENILDNLFCNVPYNLFFNVPSINLFFFQMCPVICYGICLFLCL